MNIVVLLRHGESEWNERNVFTGWTDVDLSDKGCEEARDAGRVLKVMGYKFDVAFTSVLKRSIRTLWYVLDEMNLMWIPVFRSWKLNERHYGMWQGRNKTRIKTELYIKAKEKGIEEENYDYEYNYQHRGYKGKPEEVTYDDPRYPGHDPRYQHLKKKDIPLSESLHDVVQRLYTYWQKNIGRMVFKKRKFKRDCVLIVGHNTSLRALLLCFNGFEGIVDTDEFIDVDIDKLKQLDAFQILPEEKRKVIMIIKEGLENAVPLVCEFDGENKFQRCYYLNYPNDKAKKEEEEIRGDD